MEKWEYEVISLSFYEEADAAESVRTMDKLGEEGWELVGTLSNQGDRAGCCFSNALCPSNTDLHHYPEGDLYCLGAGKT